MNRDQRTLTLDLVEIYWRRHFAGRLSDVVLGGLATAPVMGGSFWLALGHWGVGLTMLALGLLLWSAVYLYLRSQRDAGERVVYTLTPSPDEE